MTTPALANLAVLILEDEPLVSMLTEDMVTDLGGRIVGPFSRLDAARQHVESGGETCDLALLDVNVNGERSMAIAAMLQERQVPIVFCTGYDDSGIAEEWRSVPRLRKPFSYDDLLVATQQALGRQAPS
jgi:DNA-binding LytR/AlgR family response regulator